MITGGILTDENLTDLVPLVAEDMDKAASELDGRLKFVEQELAVVERRLGRLYAAMETGQRSLGDLSPRIRSLRKCLDRL